MVKHLDNKVSIIIGADTGIREAIAHKFAQAGAAVIVNGLPDDPIDTAWTHKETGPGDFCLGVEMKFTGVKYN
ncbi:hypothetical protein [Nodularia sp. UHCC 0506]|uniref:hypothetical protein n=1 Tax=Nodularia sp. UHCC 0506 TaxID=3110243 RepID=UPI002B20F514|nr:hypothetical protein [Nodularia sp. UHCC 0506]MEA5513340.1 hypothetical protein [Nodularia sp. UHCC 0506]